MRREAGDSPHRGPGCTTGHPRVLPRQDDRACVWPRALRVTLLLRFSAAALGVATPHGALASDAGGRCANVSEAPGGAGGTVITAARGGPAWRQQPRLARFTFMSSAGRGGRGSRQVGHLDCGSLPSTCPPPGVPGVPQQEGRLSESRPPGDLGLN